MRRKKFWGKRILSVLLSAAMTFASADTRVLAAETEIAEEAANTENSTDMEHTADVDGCVEDGKSDSPTVETETGYVSEELGNPLETEAQEMTAVQNTETENNSECEDIGESMAQDESEMESSLPESSTTGTEENELSAETRLAVETEENRAEAEHLLSDEDEIASGQINDISWRIDKTGKLTVEGTGDCFANDLPVMLPGGAWPWHKHKDAIISAEVRVSGMTDASYMFENCTNLTMIDFSGFDTDKLQRTGGMFYGCNSLESLDLSNFRTDSVTDMSYMFRHCGSLKSLNLNSFRTGKVTNMSSMFHGCSSLTELDLSSFQTSRVTNMYYMFAGCEGLTELKVDNFNTGYVTDMDSMFVGCSSLITLDLHSFETDRVTNMSRMFDGCNSLTDLNLDNFNTGKVTDMNSMFQDCSSLAVLDLGSFKTDRVTDMSWMFNGCKNLTNLDLSSFETDKVADMSNMFGWCSRLCNLNLENFNTKNVTTMEYMFFHCESLTQLDLGKLNTEKLTNMSTMFSDCGSLQYLDLSHLDTSKVTDIQRMFDRCGNLQELNLSNFDLGSLSGKSTYIFESCDKLERIYVPCNLGITIPLHEVYGDTEKWNMNGKEITELPKKLKQSVMIVKGQKQPETARIAAIKKHTVYECGDEFDIDDLEVYYYGTDGSVEYVTNYVTNKDDIDMSNPGNQELRVTYKDRDFDLTAVIRLTIRETAASNIASGASNDIRWEIDSNGKLTITGSGDYDKGKRAPWYNYRSRIETADVKVSGMTDTSGMFANCVNMTAIDLSGLESKSITNMQGMFDGCSSLLSLDMGGLDFAGIKENESDLFSGCTKLTYLRTGINVSKNIKLPGHEKGDKWYDEKGTEYVTFPTGTDHGISLYRNGYPGDKVTKKRVFYDMREHGIQIPYTEVNMGDKLTAPAEPTDVCNTFGGWFKDEYYKNAWDFDNDIVTADIILYAKWIDNQPEDKDDSPYREAERIDLNEVFATVSKIKDKVYDGKPYEPSVKVTITENGKKITLTEGIDYRIIYKDNINVGNNCRMVIKGSGIYGGEMTAWYSINPKPVKKLKVITGNMTVGDTSDLPVYVYDGTKLLKEGVDYRLSYDDKIAERESTEAEVVITAKGNYIGMLTTKITVYEGDASNIINPANVLLSAETAEYTGRAIKNIPTVKIGDVVLRVNKDYKVQYQNNKDAGTATVTVIGKGAYKGKVVKSFEIIPAKTAVLAVNPISNKTYNGKFHKPLVIVKDGRKKLVKNKDYIIYYTDNLHAGTATVIIKGKGNYAGTDTTATFEIKPQKISKASVKGKKGSLTVMYGKENLKEGVDYKKPVYNVADIKKNKVKVTITGKGDFMGSVTKTVKMR